MTCFLIANHPPPNGKKFESDDLLKSGTRPLVTDGSAAAHRDRPGDMSDSGVRVHVAGFDVPDEFVLLLSGDGVVRESKYKVVWL